jgi:hypothetical protein
MGPRTRLNRQRKIDEAVRTVTPFVFYLRDHDPVKYQEFVASPSAGFLIRIMDDFDESTRQSVRDYILDYTRGNRVQK